MKQLLLFVSSLLAIAASFAQAPFAAKEKQFAKTSLSFIENKGQVTDQYGHARLDIQYKVAGNGISVFIGNGQLHYQFCKTDTQPKQKDRKRLSLSKWNVPDTAHTRYTMYRLDMALQGANLYAQPVAADKQAYYENYHTISLHTDGAVAGSYSKITYKNIYPFIDWVLYIKDNKLEYDFIVRPGGNVNDIKIKYSGATNIAHTNGNIKIITPLGQVSEQKLYAYEQSTGQPIAAKFVLRHNTVSFAADACTGTLVIDPALAWGTYYGGVETNICQGDACDNAGNILICGATKSTTNIATTGAYQTVYNGAEDAFLAKFNSSGSLLWATYYGGEDLDYANGVACDNAGNIYITGETLNIMNIATPGSFQTANGGNYDAFLAKFNNIGSLLWATYFGGDNYDIGSSVSCDNSDNVYICGGTQSATHIATVGSFQDTLTGISDGYFARFSNTGILRWATYFTGGTRSCTCDKANNVYVAGGAGHFLITTPGCYQDTCRGSEDCTVAKFDSSCHLLWSTYYGGDSIDNAYSVACDDSLNVYITGFTNSRNGIVTTGANQAIYGGGDVDAFVAKFNDTGALQWGTYYGGNGGEISQGIAYDGLGNICIAGYTSSTNNIATPGSYQSANMGGDDAFLAMFNEGGALQWATYYGGDLDDESWAVAADGLGNVYITGFTESTAGIATDGCYQSGYAGGFLAKFDTNATTGTKVINQTVNKLDLFPNPSNGNFTINGSFTNAVSSVAIEILNELGQVVYSHEVILQNDMLNKEINMSNAVPGTYLMQVAAGVETKTIKFLIE